MKKCSKCGKVKTEKKFSKKLNGLQHCCKKCSYDNEVSYRRTKKGLIANIFKIQNRSSRKRVHRPPLYSKQEFEDFCFASPVFHKLYSDWVKSGFEKWKIPSFDRADDYKGYSFDNFNRWMTWEENSLKASADCKNGINNKRSKTVIGTHKLTGETIEFHSQMEAQRQTGVCHSSISKCCLGRQKSSCGYFWMLA